MTSVALIPARGGSKRIPRKNIRPFNGEPALARVIRTIRDAGVVDRIVVSTDDDEVAAIGSAAGAEVPGYRPPDLADDHATTLAVVRHAIEAWLGDLASEDVVWAVYPTALLVTPEGLTSAASKYRASGAAFLVPVLRYPHPVERRLRLGTDGMLQPDEPDRMVVRSQDLSPAFHDAGQYYIGTVSAWMTSGPFHGGRTIGHILPATRAVDIDEPEGWERAELLARMMDSASGPVDQS